jgi:methylglyoxal synthase
MKIAMIAHDNKKIEMLNFVPDLNLTKVASGPYGGDTQIAALIVEKKIDAVFFFIS